MFAASVPRPRSARLPRSWAGGSVVLVALPGAGGGRAEVQDLAGDVGRLEEERPAREPPGQLVAQAGDIVRGRPVACLKRYQDFAVGIADRAVIDVGMDCEGRRQPDVVED